MRDPATFEARLTDAYRRFAVEVDAEVDALALARRIAAESVRPPLTRLRPHGLRVALALGLLVVLALAAVVVGTRPSPKPAGVSNGWIAFAANRGDAPRDGAGEYRDIYLTGEGIDARRIIGSDGDGRSQGCPRFSPDGSRLAYGEGDESEVPADGRGRWPVTDRALVVVALGPDGVPSAPELRVSLPPELGPLPCPEWSPDGRTLALFTGTEVWVIDHVSGAATTLQVEPEVTDDQSGFPGWPTLELEWSPDGSSIAVAEPGQIRSIPVDGTEPTLFPIETVWSFEFVADGSEIVYLTSYPVEDDAIHAIEMATGADRLLRTDACYCGVGSVAVSPDGSSVAYPGPRGIVVMDADGSDEVVLRGDAGTGLLWSPDAQRVLFIDAPPSSSALVSVALTPESLRDVYQSPGLSFEWMGISHVSWQAVGR